MSDIPGFLDYLFGQRAGWACLGYLDGDPRLGDIDAKHQERFNWPAQRADAVAWLESRATDNIYVRHVLFSKKSGTKGNALPSDILWQDEAQIDTAASVLVETSPGNYQALIKLDRLVATAERKEMMAAWRNARAGTDDCSSDPVHFVRVPGGNGTWLVRYAVQSERTYTADRLLARCRAGKGETHTPGARRARPGQARLLAGTH
jgi:hypothetical protein